MTMARTFPARPAAVARGQDAPAVLADSRFDVTPHVRFIESLVERLKIDLSATLTVMRLMPLWSNGLQHAGLRRNVASFLAQDRDGKLRRAADAMRRSLTTGLVEPAGPINLLAVIRDLADLFMQEVSGLPRFATDVPSNLNIFSSNLGVTARLGLETALRRQFDIGRRLYPAEDDERLALRIGQWLMGRDALVGTLGLTLHQHLLALDGRPLCTLALPQLPTHTGIPAIGRIARLPQQVAGCPVPAGGLVECRLDTFAGGTVDERLNFFGAGAHLCLGRPLALEFFAIVAAELNICRFGLHVTDFSTILDDVFDSPATFVVSKTVLQDKESC